MSDIDNQLERLLDTFCSQVQAVTGKPPQQEYDSDWPSVCIKGGPDQQGMVSWLPVKRADKADFSGLETALEVEVHADIKAYYGSYWSEGIEAEATDGRLTLIQIWNESDFDRLLENFIGHAMAKRRSREALTFFFACTDDPEFFLSVENKTGQVLLERPGEAPIRTVADSLGAFLSGLEPVIRSPSESDWD